MGNSWVVLLLILGWSAVQMVMNAVAKKQEKQRQQELAERRRQMQQQAGPAGGSSTSRTSTNSREMMSISPQNSPKTPTTTRDDLAARRQAQLEELRRRRMQQGASSGRPGTTTTRLPGGSPTRSSGGGGKPSRGMGVSKAQPVPPRRAPQPSTYQPIRTSKPATTVGKSIHLEPESIHHDISSQEVGAAEIGDVIGRTTSARVNRKNMASATINAVRGRIHDPKALREFIVLKEILDPPMALRETPMGTQ